MKTDDPLVMPMPAAQAAADIAVVGAEGVPSDPKSGPRLIRWQIAVLFAVVVIGAVVLAMVTNVVIGLVVLAVGVAGLLVNPVVGAARGRARERQEVIDLNTGVSKQTSH